MRHPCFRPQSGLTLMESLVVIGIMTVILIMTVGMFARTYDFYFKTAGRSETASGAVMAALTVSQAVRGASSVEAGHDFAGLTVPSSADSLVVRMPAVGADGQAVAAAFDYIGVYRDGDDPAKVLIATDAHESSVRQDGTRLLTDGNARLDFRYDRPNPVDASRVSMFVLNRQVRRGAVLQSRGWTSIFLRNAAE